MYPTPIAYHKTGSRTIYHYVGPILGTYSTQLYGLLACLFQSNFSLDLVVLSAATAHLIFSYNPQIFYPSYKASKTETMGSLNIKIGPLVWKLWPCKVRLSRLEEEKSGFFQTNSFEKAQFDPLPQILSLQTCPKSSLIIIGY